MSRLQYGVAAPFLLPSFKPGRYTKTRSRPSWRLPYVVTSISCHDLVSAHSGISRSRRKKLGCDLPHCYPCRDLKNDVATSTQLSPISATSRRHFFHVATSLAATHVATSKMMSRHQFQLAKSQPNFFQSQLQKATPRRDLNPKVQVATPTGRRDLALSGPGRARVAQAVGSRWRCRARCCAPGRPCLAHLLPSYHDRNTRS